MAKTRKTVNDPLTQSPIDIWLSPIRAFISRQTTSGIVLFGAAIVALGLSNSPLAEDYHHLWEHTLSIGFDRFIINKTLHHWINDGLMAVFFFVVGLELKREIIAGQLSNPRNAVLPIAAAVGGMVVPALFYLLMNRSGTAADGWGIPMATDIAFALGIVYLLGEKVPLSLKIFLTVLAIVDDLGAVLVIAFFYTSDISFVSLAYGALFLAILIGSNVIGIRSTVFYGIIGIGGLWLAFLLSGVHATIAAVLAAFTIPAKVKASDIFFLKRVRILAEEFEKTDKNNSPLLTPTELHILEEFQDVSKKAFTPLQRLESSLHPFVAFIVMPVFALANAGVSFGGDFTDVVQTPVFLGVFLGLVAGKFGGVVLISKVLVWTNLAKLPMGVSWRHMYGAALLAGVGFTMSLFIAELAFTEAQYILEAKMGILMASFVAGIGGFLLLNSTQKLTGQTPDTASPVPPDQL